MAQWHRNIQDIITIIDACIRAQQDEALTLRALAQKLGYSEYYTVAQVPGACRHDASGLSAAAAAGVCPAQMCATLTQSFWTSL